MAQTQLITRGRGLLELLLLLVALSPSWGLDLEHEDTALAGVGAAASYAAATTPAEDCQLAKVHVVEKKLSTSSAYSVRDVWNGFLGTTSAANNGIRYAQFIESPLYCLDSRVASQVDNNMMAGEPEPQVFATPGGDLGEFILAADTYLTLAQFWNGVNSTEDLEKMAGSSLSSGLGLLTGKSVENGGGGSGSSSLEDKDFIFEQDHKKKEQLKTLVKRLFQRTRRGYLGRGGKSLGHGQRPYRFFTHCTDERALTHLEDSLQFLEDLKLESPPEDENARSDLLDALVLPHNQGDAYIRLLLKNPRRFGVSKLLVQEAIRNFYLDLWEQSAKEEEVEESSEAEEDEDQQVQERQKPATGPYLKLQVLSGKAHPKAVLHVKLKNTLCLESAHISPILLYSTQKNKRIMERQTKRSRFFESGRKKHGKTVTGEKASVRRNSDQKKKKRAATGKRVIKGNHNSKSNRNLNKKKRTSSKKVVQQQTALLTTTPSHPFLSRLNLQLPTATQIPTTTSASQQLAALQQQQRLTTLELMAQQQMQVQLQSQLLQEKETPQQALFRKASVIKHPILLQQDALSSEGQTEEEGGLEYSDEEESSGLVDSSAVNVLDESGSESETTALSDSATRISGDLRNSSPSLDNSSLYSESSDEADPDSLASSFVQTALQGKTKPQFIVLYEDALRLRRRALVKTMHYAFRGLLKKDAASGPIEPAEVEKALSAQAQKNLDLYLQSVRKDVPGKDVPYFTVTYT